MDSWIRQIILRLNTIVKILNAYLRSFTVTIRYQIILSRVGTHCIDSTKFPSLHRDDDRGSGNHRFLGGKARLPLRWAKLSHFPLNVRFVLTNDLSSYLLSPSVRAGRTSFTELGYLLTIASTELIETPQAGLSCYTSKFWIRVTAHRCLKTSRLV